MPRWFALLLLVLPACHSIEPYLAQYATVDARRYVIVAPTGRDRLPCVQRFVSRKESEGFDVRLVTFPNAGSTRERLTTVRRQLNVHRPVGESLAYVLFLASHEELPMGPWKIEGSERTIRSDLPVLCGHTDPSIRLTESDWWSAVGHELRWVPGRIPFTVELSLGGRWFAAEPSKQRCQTTSVVTRFEGQLRRAGGDIKVAQKRANHADSARQRRLREHDPARESAGEPADQRGDHR